MKLFSSIPFEAVNEHLKSHIDTHSGEHNSMKHLQKTVEAYSKIKVPIKSSSFLILVVYQLQDERHKFTTMAN